MNIFRSVALRISRTRPKTLREDHIERCFEKCFYSTFKRQTVTSIPSLYDLFNARCRNSLGRNSTYALLYVRRYASLPSHKIITRYEDLPLTYEDGNGLPFRPISLSQGELVAIFKRSVDTVAANHMMQILHGRRVAGTLSDLCSVQEAHIFDKKLEEVALKWLRKNVPVDETHSALQRAERELLAAESVRLRVYRPNSKDIMEENAEMASAANSYGMSGLDHIREVYEKRLNEKVNAERLAREQGEKIPRKVGTLSVNTMPSRVELRRPGQNPKLIKYLERAKVLPATPPKMSIWQRLWPSILVTLGVLGTSVVFAQIYTPSSSSARLWPDVPPAAATVLSLIIINAVVFAAWRFPPALRILNKYFVSVPGYPRALAVLGSTFSHQTVQHLLLNMTLLWLLGTRLHDDIGRANFLAVYLSSGVLSSLTSLTVFTIRSHFTTLSLGASGAICGIIAAYLWLHGPERFKVLFLPPDPYPGIPAYAILSFIILMDIYGLRKGWKVGANLDYYAHLGGYASGIAGGEIMKGKLKNRQRRARKDKEHGLR